jgi:hypothetical protein
MANGPKYDGSDAGPIDLATAKKWAANYRKEFPGQTLAHYFGSDIIKRILEENDCSGIRIYYAIDDNGKKQLLLVGADSKGENLLPSAGGESANTENEIGEFSWPCPDYCPSNGL